MHALAAMFGCRVRDLERGLSAQEFEHWRLWRMKERVGPEWDRLRHAELLAAIYTGGAQKRDGSNWGPGDFLTPVDPWAPEPPPKSHEEKLRDEVARLELLWQTP